MRFDQAKTCDEVSILLVRTGEIADEEQNSSTSLFLQPAIYPVFSLSGPLERMQSSRVPAVFKPHNYQI